MSFFLIVIFLNLNFCLLTNSYEKYSISSPVEESDPCYDRITKQAKRCIPNFENVAFKKVPLVSSTCGSPPIKYCINQNNFHQKHSTSNTYCSICDSKNEPFSPNAFHLTDLEQTNQTCWVSAPVYEPYEISNISIIISFGKKYELTYISLEFCNQVKPDSLAIFKSMDHGKSWIPFQFYSSECEKIYNRPLKVKVTQSNEQEAICSDSHLKLSKYNLNRIGFSTLDGRPSFHDFDRSPVLQDWVTATDIKIVFTRLLSPSMYKNLHEVYANESHFRLRSQKHIQSRELYSHINNLGYFYTAVSEVAIGGRCKCNGHASRCILNREGKYQCDCRHNTAGIECERCLPFHYDRPWARGSSRDANECVACNCNNHSNQCRFNKELYLISGRKSGGVCINCKHNTAGRFCHYCAQGYYRNFAYSISDKKACQKCNCHMIGSSGKVCNQNTGQCPCKIGVTGLKCDRCKEGYLQTNSAVVPCIKYRNLITFPYTTTSLSLQYSRENSVSYQDSSLKKLKYEKKDCEFCKIKMKRLKIADLCKSDLVIVLQINNEGETIYDEIKKLKSNTNISNSRKEFKKFSARIKSILKYNYKMNTSFKRNMEVSLFFESDYFNCSCPRIIPFKNYLVIIKNQDLMNYSINKNLSIDPTSVFSRKNINSNNIIISKDSFIHKNFEIREWKLKNFKRVKNFLKRRCN